MLTPEYLASFSSGYLGMVDNLNEQIVRDIARRMIKTGKVTDTAKWQIKQAQESGKLLDDIVAEVGRFTGYSDKHVKELFKEAGVTGIRNDAKPLIEAGIINDAKLSRNMSDLLLANAKKTSGDINNLTMTTAVKSQQLYMQSLNEALLKIQSGAFSYQEALRYAIKKAAQAGGMVLYDSGAQMSLDAALRMALLTGLNQTVATLTEMYVSEASSSSSVVSYTSVFPFEARLIKDQDAVNALYHVGRNHLTGSDAEFEYCRVELWDQKMSASAPVENTFAARKFLVSAELSGVSGEKKQSMSGNLNAIGDPVDGYFNTKTQTFEEAAA